MDTQIIQQDWNALAGRRLEFVRRFYGCFFERHPQYRELFPEQMDAQMEHMVEILSSIARFAEHIDLLRPYLVQAGFAHRRFGIHEQDVENFKEAFMTTLAQTELEHWNAEHERAWRQAFDDVVLPMFDEGLETNREATPA